MKYYSVAKPTACSPDWPHKDALIRVIHNVSSQNTSSKIFFIEKPLLSLMQSKTDIDIGKIKLFTGNAVDYACHLLETKAFSIENLIFISSSVDNCSKKLQRDIILHEIIHVLQSLTYFRSRNANNFEHEIEKEAHTIGNYKTIKKCAKINVLSANPFVVRCWEEPGHYYTIYLVALAAGAPPALAEKLAFFAQVADEVIELDAAEAGENTAAALVLSSILGPAHERSMRRAPLPDIRAVQMGFHCLTGRLGREETLIRQSILESISPVEDTLAFGLGLHAYGDSFAHRKGDGKASDRMHPYFIGHGIQSKLAEKTRGTLLEALFKESDDINSRPHLYLDYTQRLFRLLDAKFSEKKRLEWADLEKQLIEVASKKEEIYQIECLREIARSIKTPLSSYKPEERKTAEWWMDFYPKHSGMVERNMLKVALQLARRWSLQSSA